MFKNLLLVLVGTVPTVETANAERLAGQVECVQHSDGSGCLLQWDFSQAPRSYHQVEYLDEVSLTWRATGQPYSAFRTRSSAVPAERLYRIRGCDDPGMARNCVSSTVYWAISRPSPDELPEFLADGNGVEMHIVKSAPDDIRIAQYNVYRLVQLLDRIPDLAQLPPMTKPKPSDAMSGGRPDDFQLQTGIYENYSERRRRAIEGQ